jgi:tetratricopeptide (TPR) repeat protein
VIELHRKTQAIDPSFAYIDSWVGGAYRELGDYQSALREYAAAEKLLHGAPQYGLALTYARMGRENDARDVMRRLDEHARTHYVPYYLRAAVHAAVGDRDTAVQLLQQSVDTREVIVLIFRRLPEMAPLLEDPRGLKIFEQADAIRKPDDAAPLWGRITHDDHPTAMADAHASPRCRRWTRRYGSRRRSPNRPSRQHQGRLATARDHDKVSGRSPC